ncbi:MAG: Ig-like domain-containing protein [Lachnospiraceae bacterium]|nr:Ig-like domain-containing protein [Lachnospiraceae bacterium]
MSVKTVQTIINGQTYNLTLNNSTGKYEATITAPAMSSYSQEGHYYPVQIKAEDQAGNITTKDDTDATLGSKLQLRVKEKVAPTTTIVSPTSGQLTAQNKPEIAFDITDNDSGVNPDTVVLKIDNKAVTGLQKTSIENGYRFTYTPTTALSDGDHTIEVNASDNDGNAADAKTLAFSVLATAPNLSITNPADGEWFKNTNVAFAGTTDAESLTVRVGNGTAQNVTIKEGSFSGNITLATEGDNTVTFVATSAAGVETTVTRTLKLDTHAPLIEDVQLTPNPVDAGKTFIISVTVTD